MPLIGDGNLAFSTRLGKLSGLIFTKVTWEVRACLAKPVEVCAGSKPASARPVMSGVESGRAYRGLWERCPQRERSPTTAPKPVPVAGPHRRDAEDERAGGSRKRDRGRQSVQRLSVCKA